jgi:uncharacterized linocin/CFP29 family protein
MDREMVNPLRQMLVGRQLFPKVTRLPVGKYNVDYMSITEMGSAQISLSRPQPSLPRDNINTDLTNVPLIWIAKGYEIKREQFDAFASEGIAIDTAAMLSAAQVCSEKEDDLLIQGWTPDGASYSINGLYQGAGNSYTTAKHFGTYGNATAAVAGAKALVKADKVYGCNFNLVLNPTEMGLLEASEYNGIMEKPHVEALLNSIPNAPKGQIIESVDITAGTGLLSPVDTAGLYIDLILGQDYENDLGMDSKSPKNSPIYGAMTACMRPRIKNSVAICTLTDLA